MGGVKIQWKVTERWWGGVSATHIAWLITFTRLFTLAIRKYLWLGSNWLGRWTRHVFNISAGNTLTSLYLIIVFVVVHEIQRNVSLKKRQNYASYFRPFLIMRLRIHSMVAMGGLYTFQVTFFYRHERDAWTQKKAKKIGVHFFKADNVFLVGFYFATTV